LQLIEVLCDLLARLDTVFDWHVDVENNHIEVRAWFGHNCIDSSLSICHADDRVELLLQQILLNLEQEHYVVGYEAPSLHDLIFAAQLIIKIQFRRIQTFDETII